jgi:hypothetical protein
VNESPNYRTDYYGLRSLQFTKWVRKMKRKNIPLIAQPYIYIGEDDHDHKLGEIYRVVETGYHWIKEAGFVIWVTTEEYKDTTDKDYCMAVGVKYFNENFWKC